MPEPKKPGRGGRREGAGRKLPPGATGRKLGLTVYLRPEVLAAVKVRGGREYVESLVIESLK